MSAKSELWKKLKPERQAKWHVAVILSSIDDRLCTRVSLKASNQGKKTSSRSKRRLFNDSCAIAGSGFQDRSERPLSFEHTCTMTLARFQVYKETHSVQKLNLLGTVEKFRTVRTPQTSSMTRIPKSTASICRKHDVPDGTQCHQSRSPGKIES